MTDTSRVVLSTSMPFMLDNAVLDLERMRRFPGASFLSRLADRLAASGLELVTADVHEREGSPGRFLLLLDAGAPGTATARSPGAVPACSFCLESPLIVPRFYHGSSEGTTPFRHVFAFPGAIPRLSTAAPASRLHALSWPNELPEQPAAAVPWSARRYCGMVSSNKRAGVVGVRDVEPGHPRQSWRMLAAAARLRRWRRTDPWLRQELYLDRLELISQFSQHDDFDLYGRGWERPVRGTGQTYAAAIHRSYRGPVEDKLAALRGWRFTFCFENAVMQGYVTEKIFDALLAGSIPVYLGAPDITEIIPADAFVDARRFSDLAAMDEYLRGMSESTGAGYLSRGAAFVRSEEFARFTAEDLARRMHDAVIDAQALL